MNELRVEKNHRLIYVINKILTSNYEELVVKIPSDSVLFNTGLNIKIIQRVINSSGKKVRIETDSEFGNKLISEVTSSNDEADFSRYQESLKEDNQEKILSSPLSQKEGSMDSKFSLSRIDFSRLKFIPVFIIGFLLVFGIGYYFLVYKMTVDVEVLVSAERFVKSFEVKLSSQRNTDIEGKIIRGETISTVYQASKEIPTTGKTEGGKLALGEIKFLNKTDKIIKLDKNTKLTYKDSGKEFRFILDDSIEVPARELISTAPETFVSGEKVAKASAESFGSSYNVPAGKSISMGGFSSSEISAVVSSSFEGGVKNTLNAVAPADLIEVSKQSLDEFKSTFVFSSTSSKIVLKNSESFSIASQKFSSELTEAADKLSVTQDIVVSYMVYDYEQVLAFVKSSIKSLIPEGYELYGKDLQIELNFLGSSSGAVFDNKEANVQLTVKSYKIPIFNASEIKKSLAGKKVSEASNVLEELDVSYNIESNSGLLNFLGFPSNPEKINVTITKQ
jgi:hypothetical protein